MSEEVNPTSGHKGAFLEIVRVTNGYAVYDFSICNGGAGMYSRQAPIAVFESKESLLSWMTDHWQDEPYKPF